MKLKLIDVDTEVSEATFGTCDFCMYVGTATEPTYIFEKEDGARVRVEGYYWDWGDLSTAEVDNIIEFAGYVQGLDFPDDLDMDTEWLFELTNNYDSYQYDLAHPEEAEE